jgi:A/G-specific adenine glycosylase
VEVPAPDWAPWVRRQLKRWFIRHQRPLPWRQTRDPYRIWVSEIMLQQTQVATVLDYYDRFLTQFPSVNALASADIEGVLRIWAGLGYYSRARNAHRAAQEIVSRFSGCFPASLEELQSLPGIGRYTAGAIASFAFDQPAPILETNTIRLISRLIGHNQPVQSTASQKKLWEVAETILPRKSGSGLINQALMELGSLVCTPKSPACSRCPLQRRCLAYREGKELEIPILRSKPAVQPLTHVGLIIRNSRGQLLLKVNTPGQWWEGLWDLPWIQIPGTVSDPIKLCTLSQIRQQFQEQLNLRCQLQSVHQIVKHSVTRYRIRYHCLLATLEPGGKRLPAGYCWASPAQLPPMTARFRRIHFLESS